MSDKSYRSVYNETLNTRIFLVDSVLTAHHFTYNPILEPYVEKYPFVQILVSVEGNGVFETEGKTYSFSAGDMVCRSAGKHSTISWEGENIHFLSISFSCESEAMKAFDGAPIPLSNEEAELLVDLIKTCRRIFEPMEETAALRGMRIKEGVPDAGISYVCTSLERFLTMLYCRLCCPEVLQDETQKTNTSVGKSELVIQTVRYLYEHVTSALTIADICYHFGISQTALSKKFRAEMGCGVMEYFNNLKIERAKFLISKSSMNFTQISEHLGFSSVGYFGKSFKAAVGLTPTEFSKRAPRWQNSIVD